MLDKKSLMITQLCLCILARYKLNHLPTDQLGLMLQDVGYNTRIRDWYNQFYHDIFSSKNGYPLRNVYRTPYTEHFITELINELKVDTVEKMQPCICLSHDIDNLSGSLPLTFKSLISERKFRPFTKEYEFISSIRSLLSLDAKYSGRLQGASTLFVAMPQRSKRIFTIIKQIIIDPTYNSHHPLFSELRTIINEFGSSIGIHGSFFSISERFFEEERAALSKAFQRVLRILDTIP